ncbi:TetR/AcrR family transcriptional regulator [Pseudarthrobacter sp. MM222]|uniref:TetR/AcrR family transcriptional regulator n=1 Tax=Pseudarthrobacter sp. MM222 TaxID=3018929 RepID=UPI00221E59FA|nr:TetR/AcrR family transcriptional regulator [Pseudarthrobacter sp. MM222]CAI3803807.1 HTH-type transcriptional regulator BetI [Pseudarthrobacter sp. MM222]
MPKIVDHDERRLELVDAAWRIIARHGLEGATMREIATEAGFANGALKPYFPTKDTLLEFAFGHVFNRTNKRIAEVTANKYGLAALRAFCLEVLPLDEERVNEARIVIPFWQKAVNDPQKAQIHQQSMEEWLATIRRYLAEARNAGDIGTAVADAVLASQLLNMLLGAQIAAALARDGKTDPALADQLEGFLALLAG